MSGDAEQAFFADGITEDIITALSRFSGLLVIARNSTFVYRDQAVNVQAVGEDLGARYVVEGSVRKAGPRVRITAQLIETSSGHHLWAERYDRDLSDIFALQDEITATIVSNLAVKVSRAESERARRKSGSVEVYETNLRVMSDFANPTRAGVTEARRALEQAVERAPDYARTYAMLATTHIYDVFMGWAEDAEASIARATELAQKTVDLDAYDNRAHWILGITHLYQGRHDQALAEYDRALELNPNDAEVMASRATPLRFADRVDEALESLAEAMRRNPHNPDWYQWVEGWCHFHKGDFVKAVAAIERIEEPSAEPCLILAGGYAELGDPKKAAAAVAKIFAIEPTFSLARWAQVQPYKDPAHLERILGSLRKAGLSDEEPSAHD
jgi:adenylate cyclase